MMLLFVPSLMYCVAAGVALQKDSRRLRGFLSPARWIGMFILPCIFMGLCGYAVASADIYGARAFLTALAMGAYFQMVSYLCADALAAISAP